MFKQYKDPMSGTIRDDMIIYTDSDGKVWSVPKGHRIWTELYEPWLAAGNTPLPAN